NIGCTESINLDGGGSTVMLINGTEIVKPSDGKQRSVGSCAAIM
ncbi:MAG: phosphodiester glycosidase family protein, partial [Muribaculaceae bacterium]|nr:phosphodiester glycosidase family protein [Muribaculaceae bacterium]